MKVNFEYSNAITRVNEQISRIPESLDAQKKPIMVKMSKAVKNTLIEYFKEYESEIDEDTTANYDGTKPYIHLYNDVKTTTKDNQDGMVYATIRGGKYTGYKWHMIENGTSHSKALHLIEKTMERVESEIDSIVDQAIAKAVKSGN